MSSCDWTDSVLEIFLEAQAAPLEHVQEVGVAAGVELIGASSWTPRSPSSRASTRCTMVAPTWLLMSSPTIGRPRACEARGPLRVRRDEDGHAVHEGDAGLEAGLCVVADRLLGADRQVADEHVGAGFRWSTDTTSHGRRIGHAKRALGGPPRACGRRRRRAPGPSAPSRPRPGAFPGRPSCSSAARRPPPRAAVRPCGGRRRRRRPAGCPPVGSRRSPGAARPAVSARSWVR